MHPENEWRVGQYSRLPPNQKRKYEAGTRVFGGSKPTTTDLPLVSVVTVVYNNEETLQRCIDSVINSDYPNIEYIVIDGGSTDNTINIIKHNISSINYAVSEPDKGIYHAMNKGISLCKGEYIAMINSDDWLEPGGISESIRNIQSAGADISIGYANVWSAENKFTHVWKIGNFDVRTLLSGMSFCHQAVIASKIAYERAGKYDEEMQISSDYKWVKSLFRSGLKAVFTEQAVVNFSFDGVSANNRPVWKEECKRMVCDEFPFLSYKNVSPFLEYVYRDGPIDKNSLTNLVSEAHASPLLLQSLSLVLLDKLVPLEGKNVASISNSVELEQFSRASEQNGQPQLPMSKPLISVIIPVYNVENYLEECADSVLRQSFRGIEVIFVNDGSPDNSQAIIDRYLAQDKRTKCVKKENGGLSSARNAGLKVATGEYIHFLDSDDFIRPGMYETMYAKAKRLDLDILKSNLGFIDDVYPIKRPPLPKNKQVFQYKDCIEYLQFISPCATLYRREFLATLSWFPEGLTYEDRPFNWETILAAKRIGHCDQEFYMYRVGRPDSIMSKRSGSAKHFDAFGAIDLIRDNLIESGKFDDLRLEFFKEQLRVYSMLIDIHAIPRRMLGNFYIECKNRLNEFDAPHDRIQSTNLPPRVKNLFKFLRDDVADSPEKEAGERYFFHGLEVDRNNKLTALGSACELFLIGRELLSQHFDQSECNPEDIFRKSLALTLMFDFIHTQGANRVHLVDKAARDLINFVQTNDDFKNFVKSLYKIPLSRDAKKPSVIGFQYSKASNYVAARNAVEEYLFTRRPNYEFLSFETLDPIMFHGKTETWYRACIKNIRALGLRSEIFSEQVTLVNHLQSNVDMRNAESLIVLFPNSAPERYLLELLHNKVKIFVPHGLPQLSFHAEKLDYVLSLTKGLEWREAFPNARIVHIGWPEHICATERGSSPTPGDLDSMPRTRYQITFLSQLTGTKVHQLEDFKTVTNLFLASALELPNEQFALNLRLRSASEVSFLDPVLIEKAKARDNFTITLKDDGPLEAIDSDMIISATSTGLLHSQSLNAVPLQITTSRLKAHWPFELAQPEAVYEVGQTPETLQDFIRKTVETSPKLMHYREPNASEREKVLDRVFS